jgi:peroxiredoxin
MKRTFLQMAFCILVLATAQIAMSAAKIGQAAPDFSGTASDGKTYHLADYRGKFVVLEWHNNGCPYTRKHYNSGNMQNLQKQWTARGVVWFTVISSAPRKQGYVNANDENTYMSKMGAAPTAALLDPTGAIGHLYDAKTTPQMIVINPQGIVVYDGAIDNRPTSDLKDIQGATNYVGLALEQSMAGKNVDTAATRPYGCSVKYPGTWF